MINDGYLAAQIPYYLTEEAKQGLLKALKDFPEKTNYYTTFYSDEILQGDGISSIEVTNFEDGRKKSIKGILLSNSCDMDVSNKRDFPIKLTFAPLIKLDNYIRLLKEQGLDERKIEAKVCSIKEQKVTYIFFLPKNTFPDFDSDHIALFSDLYTVSLSTVKKFDENPKLFTLSQVGFYLFVFKLSIHFCRFHENVDRYSA